MSRPAIAGQQRLERDGVTAEIPGGGTVLQLLSRPGTLTEAELTEAAPALRDAALRFAAPGQWFAVFNRPLTRAGIDDLAAQLTGLKVDILDQTSGRVRIRLAGSGVRAALAMRAALDTDPSVFPAGSSAMTLWGHIGVSVSCLGEDAFELMVLRSYAQSLWDDIAHMGG